MEFFAVTKTSVYTVKDEKDEKGFPIVEKIALRGESNVVLGERLKNGDYVGVTPWGVLLYLEDHPSKLGKRPQKPEAVNSLFYGGHTSPLVGLFLEENKAIDCHNSDNLELSDPRWHKETKETLAAIGDHHPLFVVSYWSPEPQIMFFPV